MKHLKIKLFLLVLISMMGIETNAKKVKINGIYYDLDSSTKTAKVISILDYSGFYNYYTGVIVIPETVTDNVVYSVTSIGDDAFFGCSGLTSINIPSSITSIGSQAFFGCSGLTSIIVEGGNTVYDSRSNCNAIIESNTKTLIVGCKNTYIPSSVTSIGDDAFFGCSGLTSINIPSSVTSIGNGAFNECSGLTSINIPSSVTSIGSQAFSGCSGLTSITIPSSVTNIGSSAFFSCRGLTSITIPSSVTSISRSAFYLCI